VTATLVVVVLLVAIVASCVRILKEWERAVVLRLGRALPGTKGPGVVFLIPLVDRLTKVDTRTITLQVPPQEIITRDNVSTRVTAVAYFRVVEAVKAITQVTDFNYATGQIAQTTLRSVLGQHTLDELLADQAKVNAQLQIVIDSQTEPWGVKVSVVEIKDVEIPQSMQRAMARQAEAERERRAKVISAEGEFQASRRLTDAADIMATNPISVQLRYLQTVLEIGAENNTTTLFPVPLEMLSMFGHAAPGATPPRPPAGDDAPTQLRPVSD
jgi:regulator of protease activity HflC (stomatin/prohibitin superfamily)